MRKYNIFRDERGGDLIPVEFSSIPFEPKRIFTVSGVPKGQIRGNHAHFNTKQVLICVCGEILVGLHDANGPKEVILRQGDSVFIDKMVWDWQQFLTGQEYMVVICSTKYDKTDYIEDFEEFNRLVLL